MKDSIKRIFLLRHSKSCWNNSALIDFDRPLSGKGVRDATLVGEFFLSLKVMPNLILCSPSRRTKETFKYFFSNKEANVVFDNSIYHSSKNNLFNILIDLDERINSVMLIGHNPEIHEISEKILRQKIKKFPTSSLVSIVFKHKWKDVHNKLGELEFFTKPSKIKKQLSSNCWFS